MTAAISREVNHPVTWSPALRAAWAMEAVVCSMTVNAPGKPPPAWLIRRRAVLRSREMAR